MKNFIEKQIVLKAPLSKVWRALTDYHEFGTWFRVKLSGPFEVGKVASGSMTYPGYEHITFEARIEKMEKEKTFSFSWPHVNLETGKKHSEDSYTLVEFKLEKAPGGTLLMITESGFEKIPDLRREEAYLNNDGGWTIQMDNIKKHLSPQIEAATSFLKAVVDRKIEEAYDKFISPQFIHHNQYFKGDRQSLMDGMKEAGEKNPNKRLEIKKILEDGNTVMTLSHIKHNPDDIGGVVVHIFRFEEDKVVELWDLGQPIVKDSINKNGVF